MPLKFLKFVCLHYYRKHKIVYSKPRVLISSRGSPRQAFAQNCHFFAKNLERCQSQTIVQKDEGCFKVCLLFYRRSHQLFVYMYFLFTIVYIKLAKILERLHGKENVPKIESCIKVCTFISRDGSGHQNPTHWVFWAKTQPEQYLGGPKPTKGHFYSNRHFLK